MFNPTSDSSPEQVWNLLGTFFNNLNAASKAEFEKYWAALDKASQAGFYELYQADAQTYLQSADGWFELLSNKFELITDDLDGEGRTNTIKRFLPAPKNLVEVSSTAGTNTYSYVVTAVNSEGETIESDYVKVIDAEDPSIAPIGLSWDSVTGADSYNVYGRTQQSYTILGNTTSSSFTDNGAAPGTQEPPQENTALTHYRYQLPEDYIYLYFKNITNDKNGNSVPATLKDHKHLLVPASTETQTDSNRNVKYIDLTIESILTVAPVISRFYFKAFGSTNVEEIFNNGKYNSKDPDYSTKTDEEKATLYGKHLKYFCWAYSHNLRKSPTMSTIRKTYGLVQDYPFAYEGGEVTDVTGSVITIGDYSYDIGNATHKFSVGDSVEQFDILCNGISIEDYYSDPTLIGGLASEEDQEQFIISLSSDYSFNPDTEMVEAFKDIAIPAGLVIK